MSEATQQARRVSRRAFLQVSGAMALGFVGVSALAACTAPAVAPTGGTSAESVPAEKAKKVQLYTLVWQPGAIEATQNAVNNWNSANKSRTEIEYIQGDWGKARDYLTTSIAGGVTPEIIQGITAWANEYGTQGAYIDLTQFLETSDLKEDIHPIAFSAAVSPLTGKVFSIPWCWEIGMMFVNGDRFKEQGLEVPQTGWNWSDFYGDAIKVSNPPDHYGMAANLGPSQTTEDIIAWMWQTGAEVMGEIDGKWQIDMETARPALQLWHDMIHKDAILSPDSFSGTTSKYEAFPLGVYSMMQAGCWCRRLIIEAQPQFEWFMIPLPADKRNASSSEPQTWSISNDSVKRGTVDAAWEVTDYLCNKDNSSAIANGDWLFPTRQSALSDERFTTEENGWKTALEELKNGKAYPKHPAWGEFDDRVMGPNLQKYLQDELTQDQLIDLCYTEGNKLIAQYSS